MITYNDIYEAARKERYSEQLQGIAKNFVKEVSLYLKEKKESMLKEEDVFSDSLIKGKKQLENAITLFRELMLRRRKKIMDLVLVASETGISKQDFANMLLIEKELFEDLLRCVDNGDKKLNDLLNGSNQTQTKNELIVFIENVSEFVDRNGDALGPYEKGQIANLPSEIVKILLDSGKVERC